MTLLLLLICLVLIVLLVRSEGHAGRLATPSQRRMFVGSVLIGIVIALIVRWP